MRKNHALTFDRLDSRTMTTVILPLVGFEEASQPTDMPVMEAPPEPEPTVTETLNSLDDWEPGWLPWWSPDDSWVDMTVQSYLNARSEYEAAGLPLHTFP